MRRRGFLDTALPFFGSWLPMAVAILTGLTLLATILAAAGQHLGWPVLALGALVPGLVWRGQVWRLATWPLFEFGLAPLGLLFACACLISFGRQLCWSWGGRRLLLRYLAVSALSGLGTCGVGLLWPGVGAAAYYTAWATIDAMIVAWAIERVDAQMVFNFVLPLRGRQIIYLVWFVTFLQGVFAGPQAIVPHVFALGITMVYLRDPGLYQAYLRARLSMQRRRKGRFKVVDRDDGPVGPSRWVH